MHLTSTLDKFKAEMIIHCMIDSHCHLEYMPDIIDEARTKIKGIVTSAPDPKDYSATLEMANMNKGFVHACLGLHPTHVQENTDKALAAIRANASEIVAIGEIGIDYHHIRDSASQQKAEEIFKSGISLANELNLPIVVHSRSENNDKEGKGVTRAIELLASANVPVMMHFFSGSDKQMQECISRGYMISFTTMICTSKKYRKLAKNCPLDNMLLETDAPWLDPDSPGTLTNRPWNIIRSAEVIAEVRGTEATEILEAAERNAVKFFRI